MNFKLINCTYGDLKSKLVEIDGLKYWQTPTSYTRIEVLPSGEQTLSVSLTPMDGFELSEFTPRPINSPTIGKKSSYNSQDTWDYIKSCEQFASSAGAFRPNCCVSVDNGIIVHIYYDCGDNGKTSGCNDIYEFTPYNKWLKLDNALDKVRINYPDVYEQIERYIELTKIKIQEYEQSK